MGGRQIGHGALSLVPPQGGPAELGRQITESRGTDEGPRGASSVFPLDAQRIRVGYRAALSTIGISTCTSPNFNRERGTSSPAERDAERRPASFLLEKVSFGILGGSPERTELPFQSLICG